MSASVTAVGGRVEQIAGLPAVREVGSVEPREGASPDRHRLAIGQGARLAITEVVDRHHRRDLRAQRTCARRDREEVVQATRLVGLDMRERDPAKLFDREHGGDRLLHQREHLARTGVEDQRLVIDDEVLVEREPTGHAPDRRVDAVDAILDLVDLGP
jgi:hypothetical protein